MDDAVLELLDELISLWNGWPGLGRYYLKEHIPMIVREAARAPLQPRQLDIVACLRRSLSDDRWRQLGTLIVQRQADPQAQEKAKYAREEKARHERESEHERAKRRARADRETAAQARRDAADRAQRQAERQRREEAQFQALKAQTARRDALIARLQHAFASDFLSADQVLAAHPDGALLSLPEYQRLKTDFVHDWAARTLQLRLDHEQAAAIAATDGDIQVVARAGSGKTRTLVARAIFLQKHCGVSSHELLLLAFNKKSADEMSGRLSGTLGTDLPHVMTFHALAHAIVHPDEELLFDDTSTGELSLSREIQDVIDDHLGSSEYRPRIRDVMLAYFRDDWERIVKGGFQLTTEELLAYRRSLPRETLKRDYVKSYGEKVIANALFEHAVEYKYERNFHWDDINYRPDFTIQMGSKGGVIIEYFGLQGDADYDAMTERKRRFWAARDEWTFLEFSPSDLARRGEEQFVQALVEELRNAGVSCRRRTEEEIWELVKGRALDRFTQAMRTFVGRCRKLNLTTDELQARVEGHPVSSTAEAGFLDVAVSVYRGYLRRLASANEEDFDGLVWRAAALVRDDHTSFVRDRAREHGDLSRLKFVLIDEFQDFSQMFFQLTDAIRSVNSRAQFFCVGDDWQAINGFAGSETRFFENFATYFRRTSRYDIRTNYRSLKAVVAVGNALMSGRGPAANAARSDDGSVLLCSLTDFRPSGAEQAKHNGDDITPAVLRVIRCFLDRDLDVVMLARRNGLPWYVSYGERWVTRLDPLEHFAEHVRSCLPKEDRSRVTISTAHRYKGLEQAAVIVLDAVARSFPLLHPTWIFLRIFGGTVNQIEAEERRLFYVAITRAKEHLALITDGLSPSPYLGDIDQHFRLVPATWADLPPAPSLDGSRVEIRISNALEVRNQLKQAGYHFSPTGQYWYKSVPSESFSFDVLLAQPWSRNRVTIRVYSETGKLLHGR
jgi:DNA helicase IV